MMDLPNESFVCCPGTSPRTQQCLVGGSLAQPAPCLHDHQQAPAAKGSMLQAPALACRMQGPAWPMPGSLCAAGNPHALQVQEHTSMRELQHKTRQEYERLNQDAQELRQQSRQIADKHRAALQK